MINTGVAWYIMSMPANLPPEYFSAEKRYKEARDARDRIAALEELIATIPKHKGTDKLRADLRARLSKLRDEAVRKKGSSRMDIFTVDREGARQICLAGLPNAGKSSLLKSLTNAQPVIADYPVSTVLPLSGMMPFEDIQFQLVDLPPIGNESTDGWVSGLLRNTDLLYIVVDLSEDPEIQAALLVEQLTTWRIVPVREGGLPAARDILLAKKCIVVANKADLDDAEKGWRRLLADYEDRFTLLRVSALRKTGLEDLKSRTFGCSGIIRVYSKEPGKDPDLHTPFTIPVGSTVLDLAEMIHKDFVTGLKYVCLWGSSKFPGQRIQRDYVLRDRDIVEFRI